jgi:cysteine-rich PDZ-binding protein
VLQRRRPSTCTGGGRRGDARHVGRQFYRPPRPRHAITRLACPDKWKGGGSSKINLKDNKILSKTKKWAPSGAKCKVCSASLLQKDYTLCQSCAYRNGKCAMCGTKVLDTTAYRQSTA